MPEVEASEYRAHYQRRKLGEGGGKDGTRLSGFVTAGENRPPRECGACRHMIRGYCQHPVVNVDPELAKWRKHEGVEVKADSCCDFFQNEQGGI